MRHYEIVFLIHPDQSDQASDMLARYKKLFTDNNATIHRVEDWGRRTLAYPIKKVHKAHYILMNVECDASTLVELTTNFRFNDAIIRHLVVRRNQAILSPSHIAKADEKTKKVIGQEEKQQSIQPAFQKQNTNTSSNNDTLTPEKGSAIDDEAISDQVTTGTEIIQDDTQQTEEKQ